MSRDPRRCLRESDRQPLLFVAKVFIIRESPHRQGEAALAALLAVALLLAGGGAFYFVSTIAVHDDALDGDIVWAEGVGWADVTARSACRGRRPGA